MPPAALQRKAGGNWRIETSRGPIKADIVVNCGGMWAREISSLAGGVLPDAHFVLAHGYDHGWTTNLPIEHFLAEDALVAFSHNGEPLTLTWKSVTRSPLGST